ncbi:hypothetical protein ACEQ8H_000726 [Pleosporales sp. CAS-2024a]
MSGLDPKGPSQPTLTQAYTTPGNPASQTPAEQAQASVHAADNSPAAVAAVDQRIPTKQASDAQGLANAKPPAAGRHGAPPGEEANGLTEADVGRHKELDGEQMAAAGEGDVAAAVAKRGKGQGGGGAEPDLASDLDRKKAEQAQARDAIKQSK